MTTPEQHKMKYEIKNRWDGTIIYQDEADSFRALVEAAFNSGANLYGFFSFGPGGSRNAYTWARWEECGYMVHCGCQVLTLKDFAAAVKKTHGRSDHAKWYAANIKTMALVAKMSEKAFRERQEKEKATAPVEAVK